MAKFKCLQTNSVHEFLYEHDIEGMRSHPQYEEVVEVEQVEEEKPKKKKLAVSGE
jgi:hypothetical protein